MKGIAFAVIAIFSLPLPSFRGAMPFQSVTFTVERGIANKSGGINLWFGAMPRREWQLLVLVCVVDGGLQVYGDGVISRDFGGNVD